MIEDALKSTRNLHRLIIGVSLAVLVFSLSMYLAEDKIRQKTAIDSLIEIDFLAYESWLQKIIDAQIQTRVIPAVKPVRDFLDNSGHLIFELDSIADALEKPAHVGQFKVSDSILANLSAANLNSLHALNGFSLDQDVQITIPVVQPVIEQLEEFLSANSGAGKRITNARTSVTDEIPMLTTFLPDDASIASLDFELTDISVAVATPVFQGLYEFELLSIPDTSYISWLSQQGLEPQVVINVTEIEYLPQLSPWPSGFSEESLGKLSLRLADEIRDAGPDQRTIKILGTEVPGRLLVLAAPLVLLALLYYFKSHLSHVTRMATDHAEEMIGFSWLPINSSLWKIPGTQFSGSAHVAEVVITLAVLPVCALLVMFYRLSMFGSLNAGTSLLIGCTCAIAILICWMSLQDIRSIRNTLHNGHS